MARHRADDSEARPDWLPEISDFDLGLVASGTHHDPHSILGSHIAIEPRYERPYLIIRALRPLADAVVAELSSGAEIPLEHIGEGVWEGYSDDPWQDYRIRASYHGSPDWVADDPYRYPPTLGELDLHLIGEGRHELLWTVLGSRYREHASAAGETVSGTAFAVWAPHARAVRVIGDFNGWEGKRHGMRSLGGSGVWELFIPELEPGQNYKYEILSQHDVWQAKADPMARYTEVPPATASIVGRSQYVWQDDEWLARRAVTDPHNAPTSVYEMHFGSWRPGLSYREAADPLIDYLTELGFTHVEFMPLSEHPYGPSWGYQVTSYFAPTSRFGHPDDLRYLIDRLHQAGIGVIMDWVPAHFPKDAWALAKFDGEALYEHPDPRRGEHPDWGTLIFDFGNPRVRNFMVASALYWIEEFHVDALRVDAVASMLYLDYSRKDGEWLPNQFGGRENLDAIGFLQEVNATVYKRNPGAMMIAEESTSWPGVTKATDAGGLGFGLKWNMGWMHDSLQYIERDPMHRSWHHNELTFSFLYAFSENFMLPISHDEVVHGKGSLLSKMPGDHWQKLANLRLYLAFMWTHPGKQLLFMGQEFGQPSEWSEQRGLDWWILEQPSHQGLTALVARLNGVYIDTPALWQRDNEQGGFQWIEGNDSQSGVLAYLRWDAEGVPAAALLNFSGNPVGPYRIGLPFAGEWQEAINTDALEYGGSGVGNFGTVHAEEVPWGGFPASAEVTFPPLAGLVLRPAKP